MNQLPGEERYRALFSSIDEGFCIIQILLDDRGTPVDYLFLEVNPAFERHTGLIGATGRRVRELAPALESHWFDIYGKVALTGQPTRFENESVALGRWFDVNAFRLGPSERLLVGILFRDITRQKRDEAERNRLLAALENERARLSAVVEQAPAFMAVLRGPDHVFELANERYFRLVGQRDILGKPVRLALPEVEGQGFVELLDRVYRTGQAVSISDMLVRVYRQADQPLEERFVEFVFQPIRDPDGTVSGILVHGVDFTDRKRAEDALRQSERRFRQLADAMPQMVWITRPDGHHEYFNGRWYEFTGIPEGSTDGEGWNKMFHADDRDRAWAAWRHSLRTGEPYEVEYRLRHHSGEYRWTLGRALPVRDERGTIERWFGTCTDIDTLRRLMDERESLRVQAEAANRAKDRFLAVLSHELRTPLTPVALAATVMEMDASLPYEFRDNVAMIRRNIDLETRLIDDLLDLSYITTGKLRLNLQPTRVHDVVRHVIETVGPDLRAKPLRVESNCSAQHDLVDADAARLQQVLWNLLKNAGKFTPAGGAVTVTTRDEPAGQIAIEVRDTGVGIEPTVLSRVFDPFEQGADEVTRRHGGMGLGLAIAKAVIDLHGGTITATSDGAGQGATFTVRLPCCLAAAPDTSTPAHPAHDGPAPPVRILLVEDHADTATTLSRLLRRGGLEVRCAGSMAAALELAGSEPFDVVISDIGLPDGTGHALMAEMRRRQDRPIAGIAMSGYGRDEDIRASREAGFKDHLVKPVDLTALEAAIRRVTDGHA